MKPPNTGEPVRRLAIPEIKVLRELRTALAYGGLPAPDQRTPEDHARISAFRVVGELLRFFGQFQHRVENGECCCIVEREHPREMGRLVIEFAIVVLP